MIKIILKYKIIGLLCLLNIAFVSCSKKMTNDDVKLTDSLEDSLNQFNYIIGTQQIGGSYSFGTDTRVVNAAKEMLNTGETVFKTSLHPKYATQLGVEAKPIIKTLVDLVKYEPSLKKIFDMPFHDYVLWAYPFTSQNSGIFGSGGAFSKKDQEAEYNEMYALTIYLLTHYAGTNKNFYLGNWEGDWHLFQMDLNNIPSQVRIQAMADWLNIRQKAVDDAKRDIGIYSGVQVYFYVEENQALRALNGQVGVINSVFPLLKRSPDFISMSTYNFIKTENEQKFHQILDYIESKLDSRPDIPGSRIIIGEYGFAITEPPGSTAVEQAEKYRSAALKFLSWGSAPKFILSWQVYDNVDDGTTPKEFNLVNSKGEYTPIYTMHHEFLKQARAWVKDFYLQNNRMPKRDEYVPQAIEILRDIKL